MVDSLSLPDRLYQQLQHPKKTKTQKKRLNTSSHVTWRSSCQYLICYPQPGVDFMCNYVCNSAATHFQTFIQRVILASQCDLFESFILGSVSIPIKYDRPCYYKF
jgi:hypothetical protein